jgi:hypothetical protein
MRKLFLLFTVLLVIYNFHGFSKEKTPTLHVCTVASHKSFGLDQLLKSAAHFQVPVKVMGIGLPYQGNGMKLIYVRECLDQLPQDDVLMFIDAFDCLILANAKTILANFLAMQSPFIISVESNCHPFRNLAVQYPWVPTPYRYINSGSFIGYVGYMQQLLDDLAPITRNASDQGQFTKHYLRNSHKYRLDYYQQLFWALQGTPQTEMEIDHKNHRVRSRLTGSYPCVIHGNGGGRVLYQHVYDTLFQEKQ